MLSKVNTLPVKLWELPLKMPVVLLSLFEQMLTKMINEFFGACAMVFSFAIIFFELNDKIL